MPAVLVDTSVWVEFLRRGSRGRAGPLDGLLERGDVRTCGPVAAELVAGTAAARRGELWGRIRGLPWIELDADGWKQVGDAYAALRSLGKQVPLTDCVIAVAAVSAAAALWTFDDDFTRVEEVLRGLRLFEPV